MIGSIDQRLQQSFLGRRLRESIMESAGYDIDFSGKNRGFLGLRGNYQDVFKGPGAATRSMASKSLSMAGRTALSSLGLASSIYFMYTGYQEGGVFGAAKGVVSSVLYGAAFRTAIMGLGAPITVGAMAIGAAGYGAYHLGEAGQRYQRRLKSLEVGGDENMINAINSYGASTMRQRAATALNNSHINRRLALGNEASMFHSSFRR